MTKDEKAELAKQAKRHGFDSVTEFVKAVVKGAVKVAPKIKALALSAMGAGAEQSGCGMMMFLILGVPTALWLYCQCSA